MFNFIKEKLLHKKTLIMVVAILTLLAVPVLALVQLNLFTATTPTVTNCVVILAGGDADPVTGSEFVTVNVGETVIPTTNPTNMTLTQVSVEVDALLGGRNNYTDLLDISNSCGHDVDVYLLAEADPAGVGPVDYVDAYLDLRAYVSKTANPTTLFSVLADWYNVSGEYVEVLSDGSGSYTLSDAQSATVTIPTGSTRQVGMQVDVDASSTNADTATFYITVVSTN